MKEIHPIKNYDKYLNGLSTTMEDKMFFTKFISEKEIKAAIDFGCGDGELLSNLRKFYPNILLIGVDANPVMVDKAKDMLKNDNNNFIVGSFEQALRVLFRDNIDPKDTIVNCSSVIHEVYSYWTPTKVLLDFWLPLLDCSFKYVSIRDMCLSNNQYVMSNMHDVMSICKKLPNKTIEDFERCHGSICKRNNLIHLLMKYRYTDNWDRECAENYFPITIEELMNNFAGWQTYYYERFSVPFMKQRIEEDFGIQFNDATHIKVLFKHR